MSTKDHMQDWGTESLTNPKNPGTDYYKNKSRAIAGVRAGATAAALSAGAYGTKKLTEKKAFYSAAKTPDEAGQRLYRDIEREPISQGAAYGGGGGVGAVLGGLLGGIRGGGAGKALTGALLGGGLGAGVGHALRTADTEDVARARTLSKVHRSLIEEQARSNYMQQLLQQAYAPRPQESVMGAQDMTPAQQGM